MVEQLDVALSYVGLKEVKGVRHNPTILGWLREFGKNIGRWGKSRDETPWCAVFVSHVLDACGFATTGSALAASYLTYGKPGTFAPGDVIVLQRRRKDKDTVNGSMAGNHVAFLIRTTRSHYLVVGGNQKDKVSKRWYSKKNYLCRAIRKPVLSTPRP